MDYFKLLREFYIRQSVNPLSTGQIALWHGLVHQCNQLGWPREFNMPNRTLEMLTGLSRAGIAKARNALKQSGLIEYESHGVRATSYKITDITIGKSTSNSTQGSTQVTPDTSDSVQGSTQPSTQGSAQDSTQPSTQDRTPYTRQDQTKLDETRQTDSQVECPSPDPNKNAFKTWETVWGFPNSIASQDLMAWIDEFGDALVVWVIEYAARRNVKAQAADKYLDKVFTGYHNRAITTVEQAEAEAKAHETVAKANAPQQRYGRPSRQEETPEWLQPGYTPESKPVTPESKASINAGLDQLKVMREARANASTN